jgi:hypothetical protein
MEDFDYTDAAEATIRLEIEGEETLVHHAQHVSKADQQAVAELVAEKSREFSPEGFSHDTDWMEDNLPSLAMEIYGMISTQFSDLLWEADIEALDEFDYAEVHLLPFFSYEEGAWETSQYDTENYSRADVTGSYMTLLNAAHCVDRIEEKVAEREGHSTSKFLSESHFNSQVTQGLMIALRDAHVSPGEKPALQGVMFNDRSNGVVDAMQSVIGMELSDAELHGLLLAPWNERSMLQSASDYGKKQAVSDTMGALEDLAEGLKNE